MLKVASPSAAVFIIIFKADDAVFGEYTHAHAQRKPLKPLFSQT